MQIATAATAFVFVVWVTTLGVRLSTSGNGVAEENTDTQQTQLASVASGAYAPGQNTLEVATTTTDAFGTQ